MEREPPTAGDVLFIDRFDRSYVGNAVEVLEPRIGMPTVGVYAK